ncbi:TetR/AcrR family transcriptional regulator [Nocardiopsis sp. EMB25]|uniref:TetR/AcrR family transcriptional regulator n=1 Tax=Nocardiopsis sp. EMB25 TaxID=2835867 RepID=UPI002284D3E6|nr:TetR/AcrR family transcriptional regulator [Nocardiopsis sp. EMB25]MCY9787717.1 TetR/AcrR family transcriptional regulator [Nocardiopsis sp. EMB25]
MSEQEPVPPPEESGRESSAPPEPDPPAHRGRGRPRATRRRDQILDAALAEFGESGFQGASLAAVARRVGLSQQGLLHHFPSKEALLIAVLARRDEVDVRELDGLGDTAALTGLAERNTRRPEVVRLHSLLTAEGLTGDHPASAYVRDRYARVRERLAHTLRTEHGDRLPSGATPDQAAALLTAAMDGLQLQWLYDPDSVDMPDLMGLLTDVLRGAAPDPTPP